MIINNLTTKMARNISTADVSRRQARACAQMQYVPDIGEKGALVLLGGSSFQPGELSGSDIMNLVS